MIWAKNAPCSLPFTQMFIQSSGRVYPCSFLQNSTVVGDTKKNTLEEIWNSREFSQFRDRQKSGEAHECARCQNLFHCQLKNQVELGPELLATPLKLDFMVDSFCNLRCRMCTNVYEERGGFDDPLFWQNEEAAPVLANLKELEIIGGEPLLSDHFYRLVTIMEKVNPACEWYLTTNGSFQFSSKMKEAFKSINFKNIGLSIDSLRDDIFAKIRSEAKLSQVLLFLDEMLKFSKEEKPLPLDINMVVQMENAYEVPAMISFARKKDIGLHLILLRHPDDFSLVRLLDSDPKKYHDLIASFIHDNKTLKSPQLFILIMEMIDFLSPQDKLIFVDEITKMKDSLVVAHE